MKHSSNNVSGRVVGRVAVAFCLCVALNACDMFASAEKIKSDAMAAMAARNFSSAAQNAQKWSEKAPDQYEAFFFLAQAQAQAGDKNAALSALEQAIKKGLKDDAQIDGNANLEPIKGMSAFESLMRIHFPDRKVNRESPRVITEDGADVSIQEKDGQQVLRAGDVVIQMPVNK